MLILRTATERAKSGRSPNAAPHRRTLNAHSPDRNRACQERAIATCNSAPTDSRCSFSRPQQSVPRAGDRHAQHCVERFSMLVLRTAAERAKSGRSPHAT
eukprot:823331-Alexandrium_andersonii.AAC.1